MHRFLGVALVLSLVGLMGAASSAVACSGGPDPKDRVAAAQQIISGKVVKVKKRAKGGKTFVFRVDRVFRGSAPKRLTLRASGLTTCGLASTVRKGRRLAFASKRPFKDYDWIEWEHAIRRSDLKGMKPVVQ